MVATRRRGGGEAAFPGAAYCLDPLALSPGNRVDLLVDGREAYPAMLAAIGAAERTILMESYIFDADAAGAMFAAALAARARAGIDVRLVVDGLGTLGQPAAFFDTLRGHGVRVLEFRPVAPWRRHSGLFRRNHRKLLAVDNQVGFAGGLNVGAQWLPAEQGGGGWHDVHVRFEGPAVAALSRLSMATWHARGGERLDPRRYLAPAAPAGDARAGVVGPRGRRGRGAIRRAYLFAVRRARREILVANPYFLPTRTLRRALVQAARRGVDVRLLLPREGDHRIVQLASEALHGRMLRAGVKIARWPEAMLHAKTAVVDGLWATAGSFNLDHLSWAMNLEVNAIVPGPEFAGRLAAVFAEREARAEPLDAAAWARRPAWRRAAAHFAHLFERFM